MGTKYCSINNTAKRYKCNSDATKTNKNGEHKLIQRLPKKSQHSLNHFCIKSGKLSESVTRVTASTCSRFKNVKKTNTARNSSAKLIYVHNHFSQPRLKHNNTRHHISQVSQLRIIHTIMMNYTYSVSLKTQDIKLFSTPSPNTDKLSKFFHY